MGLPFHEVELLERSSMYSIKSEFKYFAIISCQALCKHCCVQWPTNNKKTETCLPSKGIIWATAEGAVHSDGVGCL